MCESLPVLPGARGGLPEALQARHRVQPAAVLKAGSHGLGYASGQDRYPLNLVLLATFGERVTGRVEKKEGWWSCAPRDHEMNPPRVLSGELVKLKRRGEADRTLWCANGDLGKVMVLSCYVIRGRVKIVIS